MVSFLVVFSYSTSWDEHMFELVLPKACCVGHIDIKFTLHPLCTSAPMVQFTLLKQNISNLGWNTPGPTFVSGGGTDIHVDEKIDFNLSASAPKSDDSKLSVINSVLDKEFLEKYGAEVVCGPVDLRSNLDLSGHGGVITLSSPQLLKLKSRSYLLHIKPLLSPKDMGKKDKGSQVML